MNAATDDPMFFTPNDFFDEVPMASPFTSHSNSTILLSLGHHSDKFQSPAYPSSATEWPLQHPFDSLSARSHNESPSASNHSQQISTIQPPLSGSFIDLNSHLACPSSVAYVDANTTTWTMNSLDNAYLPDFNHSLGFYDENQNDEKYYPCQSYPYVSQEVPSPPLTSQWIPPSYSHFDSVRLPFLDEYANFSCPESFPDLPHSFTNHEVVRQEVQSFLGYMPRAPSPHNTNVGLPHSHSHHIDPQSPYANEEMDDFSDSDTTTSTQSWMMPLPQAPFHSCPPNDDDDVSTSTIHPIGGMASSISTPLFGFDHHHSYPNHHGGRQAMKCRSKRPATNQGRVHRSSSSHTIHANGIGSKKPTMNYSHQRNELKRRESDPYLLLSTIHSFSTTTNDDHSGTCFPPPPPASATATKTLSASESIASLLSRQRLSDLEDEEMENGPFGQRRRHHHRVDQKKSNHRPKPYRYIAGGETYHQDNSSGGSSSCSSSSSSSDDKDASVFNVPSRNPAIKKGRNVDKACNHCKRSHLRCDSMRPCRRCIATGKTECHDVEHKPRGRPRLHGGPNVLL